MIGFAFYVIDMERGIPVKAMSDTRKKIVRYRKPINLNIGMVIFIVIAAYVLICVIMYFRSDPIVGYEVKMGSLSVSNTYNGLILRQEEVVNCTNAGYINYYAREGEKVAFGDLVYTIDGSGKLSEMLNTESSGDNSLSEESLQSIKSDIIHFAKGFDHTNFSSIYNFKYELQGTSLKYANLSVLESIDSLESGGLGISVQLCNAPRSGYIVYNTDGYESLIASEITSDLFDKENYEKKPLISNELVAQGDNVYKFIVSEDWKIVIPITKERADELAEESYVQIKFLKTQEISWASAEVISNGEDYYCILGLNNSVVSFCTERFVDVEIITEEEKGLKIPNSAIAEKEFFLIPKEYLIEHAEGSNIYSFNKETYMEDGTLSSQRLDITVYNETDTDYYVDDVNLNIGDYLVNYNSSDKYAISKKGTLIGVYNINKGYADFRQISILYENDEYSIVKSNTSYGLNAYDYIVLDATSVDEDDFVYE